MSNDKHECEQAIKRKDGWDGIGGHHPPCRIKKVGGHWHMVVPDWYSVDVDHCPWCGSNLEHDKFTLKPINEPEELPQAVLDALDALEKQLEGM